MSRLKTSKRHARRDKSVYAVDADSTAFVKEMTPINGAAGDVIVIRGAKFDTKSAAEVSFGPDTLCHVQRETRTSESFACTIGNVTHAGIFSPSIRFSARIRSSDWGHCI